MFIRSALTGRRRIRDIRQVYFTDVHRPEQRGSNENFNGLPESFFSQERQEPRRREIATRRLLSHLRNARQSGRRARFFSSICTAINFSIWSRPSSYSDDSGYSVCRWRMMTKATLAAASDFAYRSASLWAMASWAYDRKASNCRSPLPGSDFANRSAMATAFR